MTSAEFKTMLETLAARWTNRDYEKVVCFFTADVRYVDPLRYSFDNSADLLRFFQDDDGVPQECVLRLAVFDEAERTGAFEYTYEGKHRYHGVALVKIEAAKISEWREYQHVSAVDWHRFWNRRLT